MLEGIMASQQNIEKTGMVDKAEKFLADMGFRQLKVRYHDDIARIEVENYERVCFFDLGIMDKVYTELKKIGFKYVTLDIKGYSNI
jgi:uncharacterized protein